jgi:hypothetical protein
LKPSIYCSIVCLFRLIDYLSSGGVWLGPV